MKSLLKGVERHLHSPIVNLRTLGMVVGEHLMNDLNESSMAEFKDAPKLKFEVTNDLNWLKIVKLKLNYLFLFKYAETAEIKLLNSLKAKPVVSEQITDTNPIDTLYAAEEMNLHKPCTEKTLFDNKNLNLKITLDEEDSDDDLAPYDTSNDIPLSKMKKPAFLRDCLHGNYLQYRKGPSHII